MKKFLFLLFLISQYAFASPLLIEKHATSGLVIPENSFKKDCSIFRNGMISSVTFHGNGTGEGFAKMLPKKTMHALKGLVKLASHGEIENGPVMCDGGNNLLYGYQNGTKFIIDENYDCSSSSVNKHPASELLRKLTENLCGF